MKTIKEVEKQSMDPRTIIGLLALMTRVDRIVLYRALRELPDVQKHYGIGPAPRRRKQIGSRRKRSGKLRAYTSGEFIRIE